MDVLPVRHRVVWRVGDCFGKSTVFGRLLRRELPGIEFVGHCLDAENLHSCVPHLLIDQTTACLPTWYATLSVQPDVVIVMQGIADLDVSGSAAPIPLETIATNMSAMLAVVRGLCPTALVLLVGPMDIVGGIHCGRTHRIEPLRELYRKIPGNHVYVEPPPLVAEDVIEDGMHPMPSGYAKLAAVIKKALDNWLASHAGA